jgi:ankyrin repeat protein
MDLLRLGANPNLAGRHIGPTSALHVIVFSNGRHFVERNGPAIVEALLKAGAHVSSTTSYRDQTPLHIAAKMNNVAGATLLLKAAAKVMPKDADGKTPLDLATSGEMIRLLKSHGAVER